MTERIPIEALIPRRLYRLESNNLSLGVWAPERRGFIGIRRKYGDEHLDIEFHVDTESVLGTATPVEVLPDAAHEGVELVCQVLMDPSDPAYRPLESPTGLKYHGRWFDTYRPLFDWLKAMEEKYVLS